jgi:serine/threonine protein kinase
MPSLGKYTLVEKLGVGSMGTVYRAKDTVLGREVALKTIRTNAEAGTELRERFYREAKTCARLQHLNIVTVFDLGEQDDFAYIAMELLSGSDFRRIIEAHTQIPLISKIDAMIQICEALGHAHQQGVIHRDVKPSNLFLSEKGCPKVLDFGIARLPSSRLTMVGRVLGTPNYMAPEQILGKPSDGRADLFSAGIVFFELLTYHHPFQSDLVPRRIVDSEPDSLFDHDSSLPLPLDRVLTRVLSKDPNDRYSGAEELATDLKAIADGLRQNASPHFSKFPLPSLRAPAGPAITPVTIMNPVDAADTDTTLQEFVRKLTIFDNAVAAADLTEADRIFSDLRGIAGTDERFNESLRAAQEKLTGRISSPVPPAESGPVSARSKISKADPAALESSASSDGSLTRWIRQTVAATETSSSLLAEKEGESSGTACRHCSARNRVDASFCIRCGKSLAAVTAGDATAARTTTDTPATTSTAAATSVSSTPPALKSRSPIGQWIGLRIKTLTEGRDRRRLTAAGIAVVLLVAIASRAFTGKSIPAEPSIGTAVVGSAGTRLLRSMSGPVAVIRSLDRGTTVNILAIPAAGKQLWLIQPLSGSRVFSKGYVDGGAIEKWSFSTAASTLSWARYLSSSAPMDPEKLAAVFQSVAQRFPGTNEAHVAALEEADLYLQIARLKKFEGQSEEVWRAYTARANALVAPLLPDEQAAAVDRQIAQLTTPADSTNAISLPDPAAVAVAVEAEDARDLARAEQLRLRYDYDGSIEILKRLLKRRPGNSKAQELLSEAQQARDLEHGKF